MAPKSKFGWFHDFCRDSTLPICNILPRRDRSCQLNGIPDKVENLGTILFAAFAFLATLGLIWRSNRKKAAVGRREMQIFLAFYALMSICELFSIGGFLKNAKVLKWFSSLHIGFIAATAWILLLNALIGYQLLDDGTPLSIALTAGSGLIFLVGITYISVDTAFASPSGYFVENTGAWDADKLRHLPLYILYLLFPLVCIVLFYLLESFLVLHILRERRPMILLTLAAVLFAIAQIFVFVASVHICNGTDGKIDGSMFGTLFTLLAVAAVWFFWSSITEDEWPDLGEGQGFLNEPMRAGSEMGYPQDGSSYGRQSQMRGVDDTLARA